MPVTGIKRIFIPMLMKTWLNRKRHHAHGQQLSQAIARLAGHFDPAEQEHRIERQDHDASDKAFLLGDDREDEIIVCSRLRQKPSSCCVPCRQPFPNHPPEPTEISDWLTL